MRLPTLLATALLLVGGTPAVAQSEDQLARDPYGYFEDMDENAHLDPARAILRQAREYDHRTVAQLCPPLGAYAPRSPEESQAANAMLKAHRECLVRVANDARKRIDFQEDQFAEAVAETARFARYACSRNPGRRCIPDARLSEFTELFSEANRAIIQRAARAQQERVPQLKEAKMRMDAWLEQVNASVHRHNAEVAEKNRRNDEARTREPERRREPVYYAPAPLEPPAVTIRRDSSTSAPGMR